MNNGTAPKRTALKNVYLAALGALETSTASTICSGKLACEKLKIVLSKGGLPEYQSQEWQELVQNLMKLGNEAYILNSYCQSLMNYLSKPTKRKK
jgi:hypothetical protein